MSFVLEIPEISEIQISRILRPASLVRALIAGNDLRPALSGICQSTFGLFLQKGGKMIKFTASAVVHSVQCTMNNVFWWSFVQSKVFVVFLVFLEIEMILMMMTGLSTLIPCGYYLTPASCSPFWLNWPRGELFQKLHSNFPIFPFPPFPSYSQKHLWGKPWRRLSTNTEKEIAATHENDLGKVWKLIPLLKAADLFLPFFINCPLIFIAIIVEWIVYRDQLQMPLRTFENFMKALKSLTGLTFRFRTDNSEDGFDRF